MSEAEQSRTDAGGGWTKRVSPPGPDALAPGPSPRRIFTTAEIDCATINELKWLRARVETLEKTLTNLVGPVVQLQRGNEGRAIWEEIDRHLSKARILLREAGVQW
jgi:hypothetical protein